MAVVNVYYPMGELSHYDTYLRLNCELSGLTYQDEDL